MVALGLIILERDPTILPITHVAVATSSVVGVVIVKPVIFLLLLERPGPLLPLATNPD